jgi:hypothetical protein
VAFDGCGHGPTVSLGHVQVGDDHVEGVGAGRLERRERRDTPMRDCDFRT